MFTAKDGSIVGSTWEELGISVPSGRSGQWKTFCPNCHESRKSKGDKELSVNMDDGVAVCKNIGCESKFVIDRLEEVRNRIGQIQKKEYKLPPQPKSYDALSSGVTNWFAGRHITPTTLSKLKVTEGEAWMPQEQGVVNTIQFNYFRDDKLINVKYRDGKKNFKLESGAELIFYNLNALNDPEQDSVVITEGEIDTLACIEAGIPNTISVPNGAQTGKNNMQYLNNCWDYFDNDKRAKAGLKPLKKIVLAVDNDSPGVELRNEFIRRFGAGRCYIVDFGEHKDANELLIEKGKVPLFNAIDMAQPAPLTDVKTVYDMMPEIRALKDKGLHPGVQVGGRVFQDHFSFERGRLSILTGIPTHGKSEWLDDIICRLAIEADWRFGLFSPENYPIELHISKLISKIIGKGFNECTDMEMQEALDFLHKHFVWIDPEEEDFTLNNIFSITDSLIERHGIDSLIIDPWTEIDTDGHDDTHGVKDLLTKVNRYKRKTDLHILIVAHPTKMQKDEKGIPIVPDLGNISGSAHYYNKTDMGLTIYRDFANGEVHLYINKVKHKHLGRLGMVKMKWNQKNGRYQEWDDFELHGWDDSNWLQKDTQETIEYTPTDVEQKGIDNLIEQDKAGLSDDLPF